MKKNMKKTIRVFLATALAASGIIYSSVDAREGQLKKISLYNAISIALQQNHDYRMALKQQKAAEEKVNQAWSQLYPSLESEASMLRQWAPHGLLSLSDGQYDLKLVQVKFGVNPGAFYETLQMSRKGYKAAVEEVRRTRNTIANNVIKAYFNILLADEMISLRRDMIDFLSENLKDVRSMYKTGSAPRYDLLQAQVKLKSQEPFLLDAENKYRLSIDQFNYYLGYDENVYTADSSILAKKDFRAPGGNADSEIQRLAAMALKNRPEIIQLKLKQEIAGHQRDASRSVYLWPTITAGGYYGFNYNLTDESPSHTLSSNIMGPRGWQPNWQVRVAATYRWGSLFPADYYRAKAREDDARAQETELELVKVKRLILISIKAGYYNLQTSQKTIYSQRDNVVKAEEGLRIAKESFRAGVIKNSDLLAAQLSLAEAKTGYINAVNGYYQSLADLQKEIGTDSGSIILGGN